MISVQKLRTNFLLAAFTSIFVCSCGAEDKLPTKLEDTVSTAASSLPPVEIQPNYDEEEDGTYFYVAAVSEEEEKEGKAVGSVVAYNYVGKNDKDQHVLLLVDNAGRTIRTSSCSEPCKIIRHNDGERTPYSPMSIIGSAFEDAINGKLIPKSQKATKEAVSYPQFVSSVPKAFQGRWDEMTQDGCEGREARFAIEPAQFFNFEVQWDVTKVKLYSANEADIHTTTKDESGNQIDEIWEFKTIDKGRSLTSRKSGGPFFRRCPN